jgi:putative membrane protein
MLRQHVLVPAAFVLLLLLAISGLRPYDRLTWWMEVAPVLIALPILIATHRRFPLTSLVYALIFVHAVILMVGGAYTGFVAQTLENDLIICARD